MKTIKKASLLFASLALVLGAGLVGNSDTKEVKAATTREYSIVFATKGSDDTREITIPVDLNDNTIVTSNTLVSSITSISKAYKGQSGIKLGSSNAAGNIVFSLNSIAQSNITSIKVESAKYASDAGKLKITANNSTTLASSITPGTSTTITNNIPETITSLKVETTTKRAYLSSITFVVAEKDPQVTKVTLSPSTDVTLAVGQSKTFTVGIEGNDLTGEESVALSFGYGGDGLKLSSNTAKNGDEITITAEKADIEDILVATYGDSSTAIESNSVIITTEAAKVLKSIEIQGSLEKSAYQVGETFDPTGLKVLANYESGDNVDVTDLVEWNPSVIANGTTSITATYKENGNTMTALIEISIKTLSKITVDTNPVLTYEVGDKLDLSKMVVKKHFDDNSTEVCTDYTTEPANGSVLTNENKTLTISYPGVDDVILDLNITPATYEEYQLVTSDTGDLSGTYLIVYQVSDTVGKSFDGRDEQGDYYNVALNDNKLTHENKEVDKHTVTLEKMAGGYSIKVNGGDNAGKYITGTSSSNKINFVDTPDSAITISFTDKGDALITSNTFVFRFNNNSSSNNDRFRFYKAGSYKAQQAVYLYRQLSVADKFVNDWNTTIRASEKGLCDFLSGANKATLEALIARYAALEDANKVELVDKAGVKISESITYAQNVWSNIQTTEGNYGNSGVVITSNNSYDKTSLIALFAILGIVTISGYYIIEKKKFSK